MGVVTEVVVVVVVVVGGGGSGGGDSDRDGGGRREPYVPPPLLRFSVVSSYLDRSSPPRSTAGSPRSIRPLLSRPGWHFRHGRPPGFSSAAPNALSRELLRGRVSEEGGTGIMVSVRGI